MKMTSSRRPSTRRSTSLYSRPRQETPTKIYEQPSDVSDLETDDSAAPSVPTEEEEEEEETIKLEDTTYQSEEDEMDEDQDMMDEELEEEEEEEEEEIEQPEEPEDDTEEIEEIEQMEDDIDVGAELIDDGDATPVDDEEDFEVEETDEVDEDEDDEEDEEEQSDYEEETSSRKTRGGAQRSQILHGQKQQPSSLKVQPEKQSFFRKRGSITETSSSSHGHGHRILTKRQRAKLNDDYQQDLLQLPMEPMRKKHMTEEEIALKKSEIARRRKHQSIQRAEQDKMETINRLLKKQTTKRRTKDQDDTDSVHNDTNTTISLPTSSFHYVNNAEGSTLSIPIGCEIPIQFEKGPKYPPPIPSCAFPGCNVPKKYCSVKTFEYACSMDHLHKLEKDK